MTHPEDEAQNARRLGDPGPPAGDPIRGVGSESDRPSVHPPSMRADSSSRLTHHVHTGGRRKSDPERIDAKAEEAKVLFTRVAIPRHPSAETVRFGTASHGTAESDGDSPPPTAASADRETPTADAGRPAVRINGWGGHGVPAPTEPITVTPAVTQSAGTLSPVSSQGGSPAVPAIQSAESAVAPRGDRGAKKRKRGATPDRPASNSPISQTLMLLFTMALMLLAARFAVPRIVEEVRYSWHRGQLRAEYEVGGDGLRNVSLDTLSQAYQMVTSAVGPSVVHIDVERVSTAASSIAGGPLQRVPSSDQGSGVIVDAGGYVITNRHVIAGGSEIAVTLSDGRRLDASVVGSDRLTDLAVLKIEGTGLLPIRWGDSQRCQVGCPVWAVGSPFGLDRTVTFGILSGKHRVVQTGSQHGSNSQYQDFMQSDVAVNPGNSGGPLVDARGTLIGINTAIVGDTYQGVSFSIPSNVARQVYRRIIAEGFVDRGWLGVVLSEVPDEKLVGGNPRSRGALVVEVAEENSPAEIAGMLPGDVILAIDKITITDMSHLMRVVGGKVGGATVQIDLNRDGKTTRLQVTLGTRPRRMN